MNKDQRLLEEAYKAIYESTQEPEYFGPPERKQYFLKWLKTLKYQVNEDGSVSIDGGIKLVKSKLKRLPFNFREVTGDFSCYGIQLTSLQGAPEKVGGYFYCSCNDLTSLEGAPEIVGGYFNCAYNKLTSLDGAPKEVEGDFICYNNKITSLEGAPRIVKGDFWCDYNPNLKSLEGAPEFIGGEFINKQFSDEDYRKFVKRRELDKRVSKELDKEFDMSSIEDFS